MSDINQAIGTLSVSGDPKRFRESGKQFDEAAEDVQSAERTISRITLGPGGRLKQSKGAMMGLIDAARHAFAKDATTLQQVGDGARHLAKIIEDLQGNDLPTLITRWQRAREEALAGGPRVDMKVAQVEEHVIGQYDDVLRKLGGRPLLNAIEAWHPVAPAEPKPEPHHEPIDLSIGRDEEAAEGRAATYRTSLTQILGDLDNLVSRWEAADEEMATKLREANPEQLKISTGLTFVAAAAGEADDLQDAVHGIEQAAEPLTKAQNVLKQALGTLLQAREGDAGGFSGDGWHAPKFRQEWSQHYDELEDRLRRAAQKIDQLREQVQAIDEKFASALHS